MLHKYHVIDSVRYYPQFHVTAVGLGTYYPWIRGHYCTFFTRDGYRKIDNDAQLRVDRFLQFLVETGVTSGRAIGTLGSLLQTGKFLSSKFKFVFTNSNKNYKSMQKSVFGICVVKDVRHTIRYKIIN
jgi:hypothetical protein